MARVNVPLIGDLAIIQGETYQALSLEFPGDLTDWTPRGQIRTKLLGDAGTLLAEFSFATPAYDEESDVTAIYPRLSPAETAAITKTKWQGTGEYTKTAVYYYDVELESDTGEVVKSVPAIVQVVGEVTGPGVPPSTGETFLIADNNLSDISNPAQAKANLGITSGAKPDWDAEESAAAGILNKPDLSGYATNEAVALALEDKEDADPTILKEANIGDTVQAFDIDYPNVKSKANSAIQSDTLLSALAGLSSVSADPFIINGVAYFNRATKPTERSVGVPLAVGDRWWHPVDGTGLFFNGTHWLSETLYEDAITTASVVTSTTVIVSTGRVLILNTTSNLFFVESFDYHIQVGTAPTDVNNYYQITVGFQRSDGTNQTLGLPVYEYKTTAQAEGTVSCNAAIPMQSGALRYFGFATVITKIGNPGTMFRPLVNVKYRLIYP